MTTGDARPTSGEPDAGRCSWADGSPAMRRYHDLEWGRPVHDDHRLFELLTLEGAQAGLSWSIVLSKRDRYREVFAGFDPTRVAAYDDDDVARMLADPGVVRHAGKLRSTISNARALLALQEQRGSFASYLWEFVGGEPIDHGPRVMADVPSRSDLSDALSKELRRAGFSFVGTTIVYAFLQAAGAVNDHLATCPARASSR